MTSVFKKLDAKTWAIIGLGGATVVTGALLMNQWKHASLGRQVRRNTVRFLEKYGSVVKNGVVSGGVIQSPMKIDTAVNGIIVQMIYAVAEKMEEGMASAGGDVQGQPMQHNPMFAAEEEYQTYASMPPPRMQQQQAQKGGLKPNPRTNPPAKKSTPRQQRKSAAQTKSSPLEVSKAFKDDGGYGSSPGMGPGKGRSSASFEYNPDDMIPQGLRQGQNNRRSVFTDDEGAVGPVDDDDDDYN